MRPHPQPDPGPRTTPTGDVDAAAEVDRLRAERDAAVAALNLDERRARRRAKTRRFFVGVLVLLFAILLPLTITATWAHRTVLNTSAYVATIKPIAADPAVTAAVSREVTNEIYTSLDPEAVIASALPPKAAFLAGPIANGARGAVQNAVNKVISSPAFQQIWVSANAFAHAQLVAVLRGNSKTLQTTNGEVVLNLVPVLNEALKSAQGFVSGVVGKPVTLPTISGNEVPSAVCQKLSTALNRPVPTTCGQIPLFRAAKLANAQRMVRAFDRAVLALLIVTPLLFIASLWLSRRRRRTLLQLTIGGALGLVVVRRTVMWLQSSLIATGKPENKAARSAITNQVLNGFFDLSLWFLIGALVIVVAALVTGPYRWAVTMRHGIASAARKTGALATAAVTGTAAKAKDQTTVAWVRRHFDILRAGGVIVAVLLLLLFSVSFWGFLVIAALLAVYELWLYRMRPPASITLPSQPPPQQSSQPPAAQKPTGTS